jgi:hypothetical protein
MSQVASTINRIIKHRKQLKHSTHCVATADITGSDTSWSKGARAAAAIITAQPQTTHALQICLWVKGVDLSSSTDANSLHNEHSAQI